MEDMAVLEVMDWVVLEVTDWDTGLATEDMEVTVDTGLVAMALVDMDMVVLAIMGHGRGRPMTMIICEKRGILSIFLNFYEGKQISNHEIPGQPPRFWEDMGALVDMGLEA